MTDNNLINVYRSYESRLTCPIRGGFVSDIRRLGKTDTIVHIAW